LESKQTGFAEFPSQFISIRYAENFFIKFPKNRIPSDSIRSELAMGLLAGDYHSRIYCLLTGWEKLSTFEATVFCVDGDLGAEGHWFSSKLPFLISC
jgi:hypothetical protein